MNRFLFGVSLLMLACGGGGTGGGTGGGAVAGAAGAGNQGGWGAFGASSGTGGGGIVPLCSPMGPPHLQEHGARG
ncbi:MAG TPA: hypothetical protein PKA88_36210, partial [Polyangiaceae bacterium]|nr:hypothetical protein [Polyangiaceae bacterium]HMR76784.1 hypothetical protein [Polyangiaceae bacterium]